MGRPLHVEEAPETIEVTTREVVVGTKTWNGSEVEDISPEFHGYVMVKWVGMPYPFSLALTEKWSILPALSSTNPEPEKP